MDSVVELVTLFRATQSADDGEREGAQARLDALSSEPGFPTLLLRFVVEATEADGASRQSAVVYLKNIVNFHWAPPRPGHPPKDGWLVAEEDRQFLRDHIAETVVSCPPLLRVQLATVMRRMIDDEFPDKWSALVPQIREGIASENIDTLMGALLAV
eukprot:UC1_evm2s1139